ncbi:MEKHLA domain protein [Asticcacaulis biprosthecium C19]|uniref:MEKHLA domain protein n=1 Tax=Asticcacaulis biprosthecium C19 TaxID=715226 RepID=F4QT36_9CAUL|nr:MEKHLA domain-containing protein [Asticcacaulis biprosthecium]EGF89906.1 MEKHLA domain protein [Asticcacaulis biprosthecium C19]
MRPYDMPEVQAYNQLMAFSFHKFTGQPIANGAELALAMWHAPQAIVSHGTQADPIFRYANARALALWEMDWAAFTRLPSRLSAETTPDIQSDRNALLQAALAKGWVDTYSGVRVSSTGKRFEIRDTVLWNVVDEAGVRHGQAAFIRDWRHL